MIGHLGAGDWGPSRIESAQHLPFDEVGFAGGARGRRFRPLSEWPAIRPEGQMGAPLECSMCGIRWLHLCASIRFQPPAFFIVLRAQGRPHIVREVDRQSWPYGGRRISAASGASVVRLFVFRLQQLHARNCSVLDRRVQLLHVGIRFSNSGED